MTAPANVFSSMDLYPAVRKQYPPSVPVGLIVTDEMMPRPIAALARPQRAIAEQRAIDAILDDKPSAPKKPEAKNLKGLSPVETAFAAEFTLPGEKRAAPAAKPANSVALSEEPRPEEKPKKRPSIETAFAREFKLPKK
jgi:hypothetical protein